MAQTATPDNHVIVIFGGNGDLSKRQLLPAIYHLHMAGLMPRDYRIIGNSRSEFTDEQFDEFAREAITKFSKSECEGPKWDEFAHRLRYVSHKFQPGDTGPVKRAILQAKKELGGNARVLYYLAVPPVAFPTITQGIGDAGIQDGARIVYEKPFGSDLESFTQLSKTVHSVFDEDCVYRIDHFLGKEAVQNILALRFANGMFEPIWNRYHIDHVQIDVPETLGIGTRGDFYEGTGALRDMVVTHLFQVMSFIAMEPPYSLRPEPLADETSKVFESVSPLTKDDLVRGQFDGYRKTEGVDPKSDTETFAAARVCIHNWRWAGVPFFLRTGKRLGAAYQSVTLAFNKPPREMFAEEPTRWFDYDHLTFRLGDEAGVSVTFLAKQPGPSITLVPAQMDFHYDTVSSELVEAYERLLLDAMIGDRTLFVRGDGIERVWEVVEDVLEDPPPLHFYKPGTRGPKEANALIAPRHWHVTRKHGHSD